MTTLPLSLGAEHAAADVVAAAARRRVAHAELAAARADARAAERRVAALQARFLAATAELSTAATAARRRGITARKLGEDIGLSRQRIVQLTTA